MIDIDVILPTIAQSPPNVRTKDLEVWGSSHSELAAPHSPPWSSRELPAPRRRISIRIVLLLYKCVISTITFISFSRKALNKEAGATSERLFLQPSFQSASLWSSMKQGVLSVHPLCRVSARPRFAARTACWALSGGRPRSRSLTPHPRSFGSRRRKSCRAP